MPAILKFHANVFASPSVSLVGPTVPLRGAELPTLCGPGGGPPLYDQVMPVSFEEMQSRLLELVRSDCEPDGFFLVTGGAGQAPPADGGFWRLNGHMHEVTTDSGEGRIQRVELNAECPAEALDAVLKTMGWPETRLVYELVVEGVTLDENAFRTWAAS